LRTEGFPVLDVNGGNAITKQFLGSLFSSIQHSIFFPTMREQGFDPDLQLRSDSQEAIGDNGCLSEFDLNQRAAWYFSVGLETENHEVKQAVDRWFAQHDPAALERDRQMVAVRSQHGESPSAANAVNVLVECLDICFEPTFSFQLANWAYCRLGNHNQHIATIAVRQH
jgi:hypothetical protein